MKLLSSVFQIAENGLNEIVRKFGIFLFLTVNNSHNLMEKLQFRFHFTGNLLWWKLTSYTSENIS